VLLHHRQPPLYHGQVYFGCTVNFTRYQVSTITLADCAFKFQVAPLSHLFFSIMTRLDLALLKPYSGWIGPSSLSPHQQNTYQSLPIWLLRLSTTGRLSHPSKQHYRGRCFLSFSLQNLQTSCTLAKSTFWLLQHTTRYTILCDTFTITSTWKISARTPKGNPGCCSVTRGSGLKALKKNSIFSNICCISWKNSLMDLK